jgi:Ku protein
MELRMAPRANWKGFFCAFRLLPARLLFTRQHPKKISFNQINRNTGHRIKYLKVDADTGEEVSSEDIMKGYKVDTDSYIEVTKDELENIALDSNRTIDIDEFVPKADIDPCYLIRPYYLVARMATTLSPSYHPQYGHGRYRSGCTYQPRTHHRVRAAQERTHGYPAPLPP